MPNHITNKITFDSQYSELVIGACCPDGKFDFETLVPMPDTVYRGGLSSHEDADFPINWHTWSRLNWGTKWNCYNHEPIVTDGDKTIIQFDTAWSVPHPVIATFLNRFKIPFELKYFDEGSNFWGIEQYGVDPFAGSPARVSRQYMREEDYLPLRIELTGYDESEEE